MSHSCEQSMSLPGDPALASVAAQLHVAHWQEPAAASAATSEGFFTVETCLRRLAIAARPLPELPGQPELHRGVDAYRLLLEVITGLHSRVPGETNVCGQFRQAWQAFRSRAAAERVAPLAAIIEHLLNDAQAIREQHLQGLGGASYGSLVRKLLRPRRSERLLVVGFGELAQSLLPFFSAVHVGLWHYRKLAEVPASVSRVFAPDAGRQAADWADHVVMTTPPDAINDQRWQQWLAAASPDQVLQLGHRRHDALPLQGTNRYDLDHLFELRDLQENVRSLQLHRAQRACTERAQLLLRPNAASAPARLAQA